MADAEMSLPGEVMDGESAAGWHDAVVSMKGFVDHVASFLRGYEGLKVGEVDKASWLRLSDWKIFSVGAFETSPSFLRKEALLF